MEIKFTILGNTENPIGEPGQGQNYVGYIAECFYKQYKIHKTSVVMVDELVDALINKKSFPLRQATGYAIPIDIEKFSVSLYVNIFWATVPAYRPIDIFWHVCDALLANLKTLKSAKFQSQMSEDKNGRVDVTIRIE